MTTRSNSPSAGFGWLAQGISVGFRHPGPLLGGAAVLVLACLLPSLITLPMQFHSLRTGAQPSLANFGWIMAGSMVLGLLLVPLYAGYLQVVDAVERGQPARALDIFKPYKQGEALHLIGYGLVMIAVYITVVGLTVAATGGGMASWYMQILAAQANHLPPPALPAGFGIAIALLMVLGLLMTGFYAISLGQIALHRRNVFSAIGDGVIGALKNVLPLLVFALTAVLASIALAIAFVLLAILLLFIGKLVSTWLVLVLSVLLYIAMMLVMFVVMFGVMHALWRDVCGNDTGTGTAPPIAA